MCSDGKSNSQAGPSKEVFGNSFVAGDGDESSFPGFSCAVECVSTKPVRATPNRVANRSNATNGCGFMSMHLPFQVQYNLLIEGFVDVGDTICRGKRDGVGHGSFTLALLSISRRTNDP